MWADRRYLQLVADLGGADRSGHGAGRRAGRVAEHDGTGLLAGHRLLIGAERVRPRRVGPADHDRGVGGGVRVHAGLVRDDRRDLAADIELLRRAFVGRRRYYDEVGVDPLGDLERARQGRIRVEGVVRAIARHRRARVVRPRADEVIGGIAVGSARRHQHQEP